MGIDGEIVICGCTELRREAGGEELEVSSTISSFSSFGPLVVN
jgi:hypothetical protein